MDIRDLIPHRSSILMIDTIIDFHRDHFTSQSIIRDDMVLFDKEEKTIPAFCCLEFMAQTISAYSTFFYGKKNNSNIGFIISIRDYKLNVDQLNLGEDFFSTVSPTLIFENSGSFNCFVKNKEDVVIAQSLITAYIPTDDEIEELRNE